MNNLKKLRERAGLTQEQLGQMISRTYVSISRYESTDSKLTLPLMRQIADAIGCTVSEIIGESEVKPKSSLNEDLLKRAISATFRFATKHKEKYKFSEENLARLITGLYSCFESNEAKGEIANDNDMENHLNGAAPYEIKLRG